MATKTRKRKGGTQPPRGEAVFRRMDLGEQDRAAAEFVRVLYGLPSFTAVVRACLRQQVLRDEVVGCPRREPGDITGHAARLLVGGRPGAKEYKGLIASLVTTAGGGGVPEFKAVATGTGLKPVLLRFWPEDERNLVSVQTGWAFPQMVEAVRFAVRVQAVLAGFPAPAEW